MLSEPSPRVRTSSPTSAISFLPRFHQLQLGGADVDDQREQQRLRRHRARLILTAQARERDALGGGVLVEQVDAVLTFANEIRHA
jgi:hypothetical protein